MQCIFGKDSVTLPNLVTATEIIIPHSGTDERSQDRKFEAGHKRKIPPKNYTTGSALPSVSFTLVAFLFTRVIKRQDA